MQGHKEDRAQLIERGKQPGHCRDHGLGLAKPVVTRCGPKLTYIRKVTIKLRPNVREHW
jgi:hypothetical protein